MIAIVLYLLLSVKLTIRLTMWMNKPTLFTPNLLTLTPIPLTQRHLHPSPLNRPPIITPLNDMTLLRLQMRGLWSLQYNWLCLLLRWLVFLYFTLWLKVLVSAFLRLTLLLVILFILLLCDDVILLIWLEGWFVVVIVYSVCWLLLLLLIWCLIRLALYRNNMWDLRLLLLHQRLNILCFTTIINLLPHIITIPHLIILCRK